jgi:hypothetical protein
VPVTFSEAWATNADTYMGCYPICFYFGYRSGCPGGKARCNYKTSFNELPGHGYIKLAGYSKNFIGVKIYLPSEGFGDRIWSSSGRSVPHLSSCFLASSISVLRFS